MAMMQDNKSFEKQLMMMFLFVISFVVVTGVIGLYSVSRIQRASEGQRYTAGALLTALEIRNYQLQLGREQDNADNQMLVKGDWKKATDKFLMEVKRLSRNPVLGENERQTINKIEKNWNGYLFSFRKYILSGTDLQKKPNELKNVQDQALLKMTASIVQIIGNVQSKEGLYGLYETLKANQQASIHSGYSMMLLVLIINIVITVALARMMLLRMRRQIDNSKREIHAMVDDIIRTTAENNAGDKSDEESLEAQDKTTLND
jgi:hypothetical protein